MDGMCDKSSDYNCYNNWDDGFDSQEECLTEYCDEMGNPLPNQQRECKYDLNAKHSIDYNKYKLDKCLPSGWSQLSSDCWIDTALYALFGTKDITPIMSDILDKMYNW